jgi:hypothetical protein
MVLSLPETAYTVVSWNLLALGRAGGGNINAVLRGGTKTYHGSLFEFFRNDILNANDFFFNRNGQPRSSVKQNIFGGSLGGPLEIVEAMHEESVMKHVSELAKQGYRFVSPSVSNKGGGLGLIMEKCTPGCGGPYEYRYLDAKNPAQIEQDLNAFGKDGFRVVPSAMRTKPHLLERDPNSKHTFSFRVLKAKEVAELEKAVNEADREGYEPIGYVGHIHMLVSDFYLVLEKPIAQAGTSR